jgi:putative transposase
MAQLCIDVLFDYQKQRKYRLHEFVVMPNHFHALLTPVSPVTLEKSVQFINGAFSFGPKRNWAFWEKSGRPVFYDHRVRDGGEFSCFRQYVHMNPVRRGLVPRPKEFPYGSAMLKLDEVPQWLKPPHKLSRMQG